MAILSLWVVYYEFHPWPFWHYGWWCIMNSIHGPFLGIMGGVLWIFIHLWPFWRKFFFSFLKKEITLNPKWFLLKEKGKKQLGIIIYVVSDMHMNLWSYNKRKVGDTICTTPTTWNRNSFKIQKEGGENKALSVFREGQSKSREKKTRRSKVQWNGHAPCTFCCVMCHAILLRWVT